MGLAFFGDVVAYLSSKTLRKEDEHPFVLLLTLSHTVVEKDRKSLIIQRMGRMPYQFPPSQIRGIQVWETRPYRSRTSFDWVRSCKSSPQ